VNSRGYATAYVNDCSCGVSHYGLPLEAPAPESPPGAIGRTHCPISDVAIDVYPDARRA
jgi:hypothetical protein